SAAEELNLGGRRPLPVPRCERCAHWEDLSDPALDAALLAWERRARSKPLAVHGDFYRRNLICRDGAIAGLIDWDELRVDHPERELAWAAWELSKNPAGNAIMLERAGGFLDAYARTGRRRVDRADLVPLIREGLRVEICRNRTARGPGAPDDDYTAAEARAFRDLRGAAL
ncbi:phosphotransferase, partial [Glycomyces tenuis]